MERLRSVLLGFTSTELSEFESEESDEGAVAFFSLFFALIFFADSDSESLSDELSLDESDELEAEEEETEGAFLVAFVFEARSASESELLSPSESLDDELLDALEDSKSDSGRDLLAGAESESELESLLSDSLEDEEEAEEEAKDAAFFAFTAVAATCSLGSESESEESELELEAAELELEDNEASFLETLFPAGFLRFLLFLFSASDSLLDSLLDESLALDDEAVFLLVFDSASDSLLESLLESSLDSVSASLLESLWLSTSMASGACCALFHVGKSLSFLAAAFSPCRSRKDLTRLIETPAVADVLVARLVAAVLVAVFAFLPPPACLVAFLSAGMARDWVRGD